MPALHALKKKVLQYELITAAIPLDHLKNHYYSVILDCPFCFFIIADTYTTNAARGNRSVLFKAVFSGTEFTKCSFEVFIVQNEAVATIVTFLADINSAPDAGSDLRHQHGVSSALGQRVCKKKQQNQKQVCFFYQTWSLVEECWLWTRCLSVGRRRAS